MEEKLFDLVSNYQPQGDQPQAISRLVEGICSGKSTKSGGIITTENGDNIRVSLKKILRNTHGNLEIAFGILLCNDIESCAFNCVKETIGAVCN